MTTPLLWIVFPLFSSIVLWFFRQHKVIVNSICAGLSFLLAVSAGVIPTGGVMRIGTISIDLNHSLNVLGRRFEVGPGERPVLIFFFILALLWFLLAFLVDVPEDTPPLAMAFIVLLASAFCVKPFLFSALLVEAAVLISIPLLCSSSRKMPPGVIRFLIFQTLAVPFLLLAGWVITLVELDPSDTRMITLAIILLTLGFSFWLAIFPFYTWVPLLAEQTYAHISGLIFLFLPQTTLLILMNYLNTYAWLRESAYISSYLRIGGLIVIITGGIWAAFQKNVSRLMGYAVIMQIGFSILSLSAGGKNGAEIFSLSLIPFTSSLFVLMICISILQARMNSTGLDDLKGLFRSYPTLSIALIISLFSVSGIPILAFFPPRLALFEYMGGGVTPAPIGYVFFGLAGFLAATFRVLIVFADSNESPHSLPENTVEKIVFGGSVAFQFLLGIFPQTILPNTYAIIRGFMNFK